MGLRGRFSQRTTTVPTTVVEGQVTYCEKYSQWIPTNLVSGSMSAPYNGCAAQYCHTCGMCQGKPGQQSPTAGRPALTVSQIISAACRASHSAVRVAPGIMHCWGHSARQPSLGPSTRLGMWSGWQSFKLRLSLQCRMPLVCVALPMWPGIWCAIYFVDLQVHV